MHKCARVKWLQQIAEMAPKTNLILSPAAHLTKLQWWVVFSKSNQYQPTHVCLHLSIVLKPTHEIETVMIKITYWYNVPEILETGAVQQAKAVHPQMKSLVLDQLTNNTTFGDVQNQIWRQLKVPPSHQALEQRGGKGKAKRTNMAGTNDDHLPVATDRLLEDLGIDIHFQTKQKTYSKTKMACTFHLRTRISVHDYVHSTGKFYKKFDHDGKYHRDTVGEALMKSFTAQLVLWMWKKHWITRFVLTCFFLVGMISLCQTVLNVGARYGYEL